MAYSSSSLSSSSTLSAKARPFVPPQSKPSPSSQSTLSAKAPPFTKPNNPKSQISPLIGEPYCPIYDSLLDSDSLRLDDGFFSSTFNGDDVFEGFHGPSVGPWNAPFDQEVGQLDLDESGITSSLWTLPSSDPQGAQPNPTYKVSQALTSSLTTESCNASNSNSYYNYSMAQIYISCANPVACHPDTSARVYASSSHESSSTADSVSKTVNRVYALPEVSTTSQEIKHEEGFDGRRAACNATDVSTTAGNSSTMKNGAASSKLASNDSLAKPIKLHNIPTSKMSTKQDDSLRSSSEILDQLDVDVDSPCWKGIPGYQRSPFSVDEAETTDLTAVNSVTVTDVAKDQPHIPITAEYGKTTNYLEKPENFRSGTKKVSAFNSERSLDVASSSRGEKCEDLCTIGSESNYKRTQRLDTREEQIAGMTNDQGRKSEAHGNETLQLDQEAAFTFTSQPKTADYLAMSNSSLKYAAQNSSANSHTNAAITNPTSVTIESCGPDVFMGKTSFTGEYEQIIDETLQCLRKRLLSRAYRDGGELNGLLDEVLLLVNDYPKAHVLKNKKGIANGCYDDSGVEAAPSQSRVLKDQGHAVNKDSVWDARGIANGYHDVSGAEAAQSQSRVVKGQGNAVIHQCNIDDKWDVNSDNILIQSNFKTSHDTDLQGEMQPIGRHATPLQAIAGGNFHDYVLEFAQSQDFENILKKNFCECEDSFRSLLLKNLWIEAEAKLLSMKYELKHARAEIELLKHRPCARGRLQEVNGFPSLNYLLNSQSSNPLIDSREDNHTFDQDMNERGQKDVSPITRPGVLRIKN